MNKLPYFLVALCLCMFCSFSAYADDAADPAQADSAASSDEVVVPPEEGKVVQVQGVQTYDPQLYERMDKLQESIDALTEALIPAAEGAESSAEDAGGHVVQRFQFLNLVANHLFQISHFSYLQIL